MGDTVQSKNGIPIRLTSERWAHITEGHNELAGMRDDVLEAVASPKKILAGNDVELLALREVESGKLLVVAYRESESDGFIITAFVIRRSPSLDGRKQSWP
jgi:hypothetical protein